MRLHSYQPNCTFLRTIGFALGFKPASVKAAPSGIYSLLISDTLQTVKEYKAKIFRLRAAIRALSASKMD
jgi:hypothetical protein